MAHRHAIEAVERTFRDVRGDDRPFGGVVFCFCGDFRQTLPVVPKGSRGQVVAACLRASLLWERITMLRLTVNMRLRNADPDAREAVSNFAAQLLRVGERTGQDGIIHWPVRFHALNNSADALASDVFPNLRRSAPTAEAIRGSAILAPTNVMVKELNDMLLASMAGFERCSLSIDTPADPHSAAHFPVEVLNSIEHATLPPHKLRLKVGCPVNLLRNLDPSMGLCNGTRMRVVNVRRKLLQCTILGGARDGELCQLPRIPMLSPNSTDGVEFKRHQWPVKLAFAMTINKAQGQSLSRVGLLLEQEVFSHGQLYVALSRVTSPDGIVMVVPPTDKARRGGWIKNVVYSEVFNL